MELVSHALVRAASRLFSTPRRACVTSTSVEISLDAARTSACATALAFLLLPAAFAVIIDRIAVTVGDQVVTQSEIGLELRLTAFLNGEKLDLGPAARRAAAERLIEQKLIKSEMKIGRYPSPTASESDDMLARYATERFQGQAALDAELKKYGLTEGDLKAHMLWQATLLRFTDARFRPAIQITAQDIRGYYDKNVVPKLKAGKKTSLEDVREDIRQTLINQRADNQMDEWLKETRGRTPIRFNEEAFQ